MSTRTRRHAKEMILWMIPVLLLLVLWTQFTTVGNETLEQTYVLYAQLLQIFQQGEPLFLAILAESLPFVVIGAVLSAAIHEYVTPDRIAAWLARRQLLQTPLAAVMGCVMPVCDCGALPVARQLYRSGVGTGPAVAFILAAPTLNPITLIATYFAFGDNWSTTALRAVFAFVIACLAGTAARWIKRDVVTRDGSSGQVSADRTRIAGSPEHRPTVSARVTHICSHAIHELFDIIGFLILSAAVSAAFSVYRLGHPSVLAHFGWSAVLVMGVLGGLLSLCSQADAFVARTFSAAAPHGAIMAFMLAGQMTDIRNTLLLPRSFGRRTAATALGTASILILAAGWSLR